MSVAIFSKVFLVFVLFLTERGKSTYIQDSNASRKNRMGIR